MAIVGKSNRSAIEKHAPWKPAEYTDLEAHAMQALERGNASPTQQKLALKWIIESAAGAYDLSYRPGAADGERDTCFAEGRRSVGLQLVKVIKLKLGLLRREPE